MERERRRRRGFYETRTLGDVRREKGGIIRKEGRRESQGGNSRHVRK